MRSFFLSFVLATVCIALFVGNSLGQRRPIPPGLHEGEKRINQPLDPPVLSPGKRVDPVRLRDEADELAKLCAAIPSQIERVNQGQLPKDLSDQLKRIEKLSKHLRSEVAP